MSPAWSSSAELSAADRFVFFFSPGLLPHEIIEKRWQESPVSLKLESPTHQLLRKLLMVPRPTKGFQKWTEKEQYPPEHKVRVSPGAEQGPPPSSWLGFLFVWGRF